MRDAPWTRHSDSLLAVGVFIVSGEGVLAGQGVDADVGMVHDDGTKVRDAGAAHAERLATGSAPWPDADHSRLRCICSPSTYVILEEEEEEKKLAFFQLLRR
jgi:hypothetical protein